MNTIADQLRWKGLAEVIARPANDSLDGADGAYVAVVGIAESELDFHRKARFALSAMDFDLIDLEDVEQVRSIEQLGDADPILCERFATLRSDNPIELGTFHSFRAEDDME